MVLSLGMKFIKPRSFATADFAALEKCCTVIKRSTSLRVHFDWSPRIVHDTSPFTAILPDRKIKSHWTPVVSHCGTDGIDQFILDVKRERVSCVCVIAAAS